MQKKMDKIIKKLPATINDDEKAEWQKPETEEVKKYKEIIKATLKVSLT